MNSKYLLRNLFPEGTAINFLRAKIIIFSCSVVLVLATFFGLFQYSLNFGIDFTGGILFEVRLPNKPDLAKVRKMVNDLGIGEVNIQTLDTDHDIMIRVGVKEEKNREQYIESIKSALIKEFSQDIKFRKVEFIGAEVGGDMIEKGVISIWDYVVCLVSF